ncbi:MAG: hypothetical protein Q8Q09_08845 [Deltaproteobacteria bacterium]|nr:hypothetical protein [Deltaproteobacteria bacterium]
MGRFWVLVAPQCAQFRPREGPSQPRQRLPRLHEPQGGRAEVHIAHKKPTLPQALHERAELALAEAPKRAVCRIRRRSVPLLAALGVAWRMKRRGTHWIAALFAIGVIALSAVASGQQEGVFIQAQCSALAGCTFSNTGSAAGSVCATLVLTAADGTRLRSGAVCSGDVEPNGTRPAVPVMFNGTDALTFCSQHGQCSPTVEMSEVKTKRNPLTGLLWLVVIASSVWVYFDAKKRGVFKGQYPGFFDLSPSGWAVATFVAWVIAFPAYLAKRSKLGLNANPQGFAPGMMQQGYPQQPGYPQPPQGHPQPPPGFGGMQPPPGSGP